ncbi:MAG: transglycosylase domain-containing protein [Gammaproteobacteria bacterium]|nr:transglycosylase domain-containing protein [Gammaproteobacteria bacterium]MDP2139891.1 transglycosylase domain-containing protein [Gammaproteobacteria bacterium]MDP2347711.1 transglycosylase domain-containing protein [Gammaproteobacteria bacterium]
MKKTLRILFWFGIFCASGAIMVAAAAFLYLSPQLPSAESYRHVQLETPLRILTADNRLIDEIGIRRDPVPFEEIPPMMLNAVIASEDPRFYSHPGVDIRGLMRGFYGFVRGINLGGGSTITMQLANNISFDSDNVYARKLKEIPFALRIQRELTKEEIITLYLNLIYFGSGADGINAAALAYYGRPIAELELHQFAMLTSVLPCPSPCNPIADPERATTRRNVVLTKMFEQRMITRAEYEQAVNTIDNARRHSRRIEVNAPYVAEMVRQELYSQYGEDIYRRGFEVTTSIHSDKQAAANRALTNGLEEYYDKRHGYRGTEGHVAPVGDDPLPSWIAALAGRAVVGNQHPGIVSQVGDRNISVVLGDGSSINIAWEGLSWAAPFIDRGNAWPRPQKASDIVKPGDMVRVKQNSESTWSLGQIPDLQGALVSVSPDNGDILALIGGYDFGLSQVNRATSPRPPGSGFKPFLYGAALENGYTPASVINDAPFARGDYRPRNFENNFVGPITLRNALTNSRNIPAVRLYDQLGSEVVLPFAKRFGFRTENFPRNDLTIALGSQDVQPMEMAVALATVANGGRKVNPTLIKQIRTVDGLVPLPEQPAVCDEGDCEQFGNFAIPAEQIVDPRVAYIMGSMMRSVIEEGSGRRVGREINRKDLMGKTGTTNGPTELWFSGFNRDVSTSVFIGFDQPQVLGESEQGATVPVPIWIDYMKAVLAGTPERMMDRPDGIVDRLVNKQTGRIARPGQANTMFELFMDENAPSENDSRQPRTTNTNNTNNSTNTNTRNSDDIPSIEILF